MKTKKEIVLVRNNIELTKLISQKTGERVKTAKRIRNYYNNEESKNHRIYYVINWKFLITLYLDKNTGEMLDIITVENYKEKISIQKNFGLRVEHIANLSDVPWNIAELVGHIIDDHEALYTIKEIKKAKKNITKEIIVELHSGSNIRLNAIQKVLGNDLYNKIRIITNRQVLALTDFLTS